MANLGLAQKSSISGFINNTEGETLIGAVIYDQISKKGAITNNFGFYSLKLNTGDSIKLRVSYIGYAVIKKQFSLKSNKRLNFTLHTVTDIKTIDVIAEKFNRKEVSSLKIPAKYISAVPSLTGEVDIMKAYQLMPGVASGAEGSNAIYVRGGSPDQNLFLLDDVPLYNVSHLGGFVSVFDNSAIKETSLIKGAFPAKYGGRLSSVVDIRMKDGNFKEYHGEFGISPLITKLFFEGPIVKDKSSFIFSARRSYIDLFSNMLTRIQYGKGNTAGYRFYDINLKLNQKIKDKDRLFFSFYTGDDKLSGNINFNESDIDMNSSVKAATQWGNDLASLRWNHVYSNNLFSNLTLAYTNYNFRSFFDAYVQQVYLVEDTTVNPLENPEELFKEDTTTASFGNKYDLAVFDYTAKIDYNWYINAKLEINWGGAYISHHYKPGETSAYMKTDSVDIDYAHKDVITNSAEIYFYAESSLQIGKWLFFDIGAHYSLYLVDNELFKSLQPRLSTRLKLSENLKFGASYSKMVQYLHLLPSIDMSSPSDFWVPATGEVPPEEADQFSINLHYLTPDNKYEFTAEAYYKTMTELIEMKQHQSFFGSMESWANKIEKGGIGISKGLEFLAKKNNGKITGWLAYTLSKTERRFENTPINSGNWFPFKYDRRHDISIFLNYDVTKNINLSATWVFTTGSSMTLAGEKFPALDFYVDDFGSYSSKEITEWEFRDAFIYSGKNNYRMPSYHRLDIAAKFTKKKKRGIRTWSFGIFNLYSRKNPYFYFYKKEKETNKMQLYKFSLFPVIPSVGYNFKF